MCWWIFPIGLSSRHFLIFSSLWSFIVHGQNLACIGLSIYILYMVSFKFHLILYFIIFEKQVRKKLLILLVSLKVVIILHVLTKTHIAKGQDLAYPFAKPECAQQPFENRNVLLSCNYNSIWHQNTTQTNNYTSNFISLKRFFFSLEWLMSYLWC